MFADKNRKSWDGFAEQYARFQHSEKMLFRVAENPEKAFHPAVWELIKKYVPDMHGKSICVPSSGDNHAVFAFALMGAKVTSCDISEKQLENAKKAAERLSVVQNITFIRSDTMGLQQLKDNSFDFVYTSNGVHVWINDLAAMYHGIQRVLKPGGIYSMFEIHPFLRPVVDGKIVKPYDWVGPFESDSEVTFAWRVQDILNAILDAGITLLHVEELFAEKDYDWPFWIKAEEIIGGRTVSREEVDRMHDWRINPMAALPNWICLIGKKSL